MHELFTILVFWLMSNAIAYAVYRKYRQWADEREERQNRRFRRQAAEKLLDRLDERSYVDRVQQVPPDHSRADVVVEAICGSDTIAVELGAKALVRLESDQRLGPTKINTRATEEVLQANLSKETTSEVISYYLWDEIDEDARRRFERALERRSWVGPEGEGWLWENSFSLKIVAPYRLVARSQYHMLRGSPPPGQRVGAMTAAVDWLHQWAQDLRRDSAEAAGR